MSRDLNTVSTDVRVAGLGKRLLALLFDYLLVLGYVVVLLGVGIGIRAAVGPLGELLPLFASPLVLDGLAFLTLILPVILYFSLQESSPRQATWGKRKAGFQVAGLAGSRLTWGQALVRSAIKFLPWQIAHTSIYHIKGLPFAPEQPSPMVMAGFVLVYVLVGIYVASALISKKHRTPYDWMAGSYVIVGKQVRSQI